MLSIGEVEEIDQSGLYMDFEKWPHHCEEALKKTVSTPEARGVNRIIYAGMGGSAIPGDILKCWLTDKIDTPLIVLKDYNLPKFVGKEDLVLSVSCSGDSEETVNIAKQALDRGCKLATISSGGLLEKLSIRNNIPHTKITRLSTSRSSLPYLFYSAANILNEIGAVPTIFNQLANSVEGIRTLNGNVSANSSFEKNPSKKIASRIFDGIPSIYASDTNFCVATRFSASLNENSKMISHTASMPELCHNEFEIWSNQITRSIKPIFIRSPDEPLNIYRRYEFVKDVIQKSGFEVIEHSATGLDHLTRIMRSIYLLDYASIYVAVLRKVDPMPTPGIDSVKNNLQNS